MAPRNRFSSRSNTGIMSWLSIAVIVILLDQLSKIAIMRMLAGDQIVRITSFFNLRLAYNKGAAFSFLASASGWQHYFFVGITILAVLYILYLLKRHAGQSLFCFSLALILGGAIGNLIDRMRYGYVIDFLDVYVGNWHWPTFNIADSAITIGAVLFIIDELKRVNRSK